VPAAARRKVEKETESEREIEILNLFMCERLLQPSKETNSAARRRGSAKGEMERVKRSKGERERVKRSKRERTL
jgi:hypothetical protein